MHACLNVDEIVRFIAHEVVVSNAKGTAVSLACCHKSLEDPVLDTLWESQDWLTTLLECLPRDVWNEDGCTVSALTTYVSCSLNCLVSKSFKRLPTMLEWARFRKYARRMRKIRDRGALSILSSEVFSALQLYTFNEPLFPNLGSLNLWDVTGEFVPFIPSFLSSRTTVVSVGFVESGLPKMMVIPVIATLQTLCPNLQDIGLYPLPRDPMISTAVSRMVLATNRNTLRYFCVDSPLTEEAREVIHKLPNLYALSVIIEKNTSLPSAVLPNLTNLVIKYDHDGDWLGMFRGATLERLESVAIHSGSKQIGDFLEAFERVALAASAKNTLSKFCLFTQCAWNPNYSSLLPFTQLTVLAIGNSCVHGCSSTINDDIVTDMARAMPNLILLHLGEPPCQTPTGVTAKGLAALAYYCIHLFSLRIHFQVTSLGPLTIPRAASDGEPTIPRGDCRLTNLQVGQIPMPEGSALVVAPALLRIFPHIISIRYSDEGWSKVVDAIYDSK